MRVLLVHPSSLMYSDIYLRLEPLGLELVAAAARHAGHEVKLMDLQVFQHEDYFRLLEKWRPEAVGYSLNYLANIPEVIDLAKETRARRPECFQFAGGHSASFTAKEILKHAEGALGCVLRGEGEAGIGPLLEAVAGKRELTQAPGAVTAQGEGPAPKLLTSLDELKPARDLTARRRSYFIGVLDPCASIEFTRGCPWDCSFCSAWTFYGRAYRQRSPESVVEELAQIREPGVFIVDDVAFIHPEHGYAIGKEIERRGIRKQYYLETRADVLLRNKEVFRYWQKLGLNYIFLGLEALDEAGLKLLRKRVSEVKNFEALDYARSLGLSAAVNIICDPDWDESRFAAVREWALTVPEIVHMTVNTPYPGTESWTTESRSFTTQDYRLFDVQHAVMPTRMPLEKFYAELVHTQSVLNQKHLGWNAVKQTAALSAKLLAKGQTNFVRMLWKFSHVYNPQRQLSDHQRPVRYAIDMSRQGVGLANRESLYVHIQPAAKAV